MRDFDIPNVLKVKNPGPEIFSLAGRISLRPGVVSDVNLGALHDLHRGPTYLSLLNSIAGGALEYVSGPENFKLPTQVANAIQRREKTDAEGVIAAQLNAAAIANRPDGTPTLPTVKPPSQQVAIPPTSNPVGNDAGDEFVPPAPPSNGGVVPPPPAPPAPPADVPPVAEKPAEKPAAKAAGTAKASTPDSDSKPSSTISDL